MNQAKTYFRNLDSLRTLSFLFVFVFHCIPVTLTWYGLNHETTLIASLAKSFFNSAQEGVSIFFVLSGFLITGLLLDEENKRGRFSLRKFYLRRVLRVWPLLYAVLVFGLFIYPAFTSHFGIPHSQDSNPLMNLLLLNNFDMMQLAMSDKISFNLMVEITWSIAIEEQFYLFWPFILLLGGKIRRRGMIIFGLLLFCLLVRIIHRENYYYQYFHTFSVCGDLLVGSFMAWLIKSNGFAIRMFENQNKLLRIMVYALGSGFLLFRYAICNYDAYYYILRFPVTLFYAYVIADQCYWKGSFIQLGNFKVLQWYGKYTYGAYLLHPVAILFVKHLMDYSGMNYKGIWMHAWLLFGFSLITTVLLSVLSYNFYERPFLKLKERLN